MDPSNHDYETVYESLFIPCDDDNLDVDFELEDRKLVVPKKVQPTDCFVYNTIEKEDLTIENLYVPDEDDEESMISVENRTGFDHFCSTQPWMPDTIKGCKEMKKGQVFQTLQFFRSGPRLAFFLLFAIFYMATRILTTIFTVFSMISIQHDTKSITICSRIFVVL
jgi:hypothetical protein